MTDAEIVRSYNEAANKTKQIGILSELTLKPVNEIADILKANGIQPHITPSSAVRGSRYLKWTPELDRQLREYKAEGLTFPEIADRMGSTPKALSEHWRKMAKPKHIPQSGEAVTEVTDRVTESVKDTPCPAADTPPKTSAFGYDNIVSVLLNGEFDSVTFENAEVCVTVRRKA